MKVYVWLKNLEIMHVYETVDDFMDRDDYGYFLEYRLGAPLKGIHETEDFIWMFQ